MAEKTKNKSGAGKFFLGALLGAAAGAVAGRFISAKAEKESPDKCECDGECGHCKERDEEIDDLRNEKKVANKPASEKKASEKPAETKKVAEK